MELDNIIQSRKSVRNFSSKKPDWRDIIECVDSMRYAPMSGNIYSLRFIVVSDKEKIQKLADAAQQQFVDSVHYVVVVCSHTPKTINAYEERAPKYLRQQAGAGIQNFLLKIQEKGLATCWVGHFVEELVKETLNIPSEIDVEALLPVGYESATNKKTRRMKIDIDRVLFFEKYGNKKMKPAKRLEV